MLQDLFFFFFDDVLDLRVIDKGGKPEVWNLLYYVISFFKEWLS
jgi:hypothetical protein